MSRRSSMIKSQMRGELRKALDRTVLLKLFDTSLNLDKVHGMVFDDYQRSVDDMRSNAPPEFEKRIMMYDTTVLSLTMPFPDTDSKKHGWNTCAKVIEGNYDFASWQKYRDHYFSSEEEDYCRGLALNLHLCNQVQLPTYYHSDFNNTVDKVSDSILLTPSLLGDEYFATLQAELRKVHDMQIMLNYLFEFGCVAADFCTTEGITKKVWPESVNFLNRSFADAVKGSKASGWPIDLRRKLSDLKPPEGEMNITTGLSTKEVGKQLKVVSDMILQAQLMPKEADYENPEGKVRDCFPQPVMVSKKLVNKFDL